MEHRIVHPLVSAPGCPLLRTEQPRLVRHLRPGRAPRSPSAAPLLAAAAPPVPSPRVPAAWRGVVPPHRVQIEQEVHRIGHPPGVGQLLQHRLVGRLLPPRRSTVAASTSLVLGVLGPVAQQPGGVLAPRGDPVALMDQIVLQGNKLTDEFATAGCRARKPRTAAAGRS